MAVIDCFETLSWQSEVTEKDGLVNQSIYRQVPPKVEYSLTDLGKSFIPVLNAMFNWGNSYIF